VDHVLDPVDPQSAVTARKSIDSFIRAALGLANGQISRLEPEDHTRDDN
jgi:hypothetical protein